MSVAQQMIGTQVRCPHCETTVPVPGELFGAPLAKAEYVVDGGRRLRKSPAGAAILNFFFWGGGYVYLGRMWGLLILIPFCILTGVQCMASLDSGPPKFNLAEVVFWNIPGVAMAWHAYNMAQECE